MSADQPDNNPDEQAANNPSDSPAPPSGTVLGDQAPPAMPEVDDEDQEGLDEPGQAPVATDTPPEPPADDADKDAEPLNAVAVAALKARDDNLQIWNTRVAQKNTALEKEIAELKSATPAPAVKAPAAAQPADGAEKQDWAKRFEEAVEDRDVDKVMREYSAWLNQDTEKKILGKVTSMLDARKTVEMREAVGESLFINNEIDDKTFEQMEIHKQMEMEMGYAPHPAALLAQALAGGHENVLKIVKDALVTAPGKPKAPKGRQTAPGANANHPGAQFGEGEPSPEDGDDLASLLAKRESQKISMQEAGFG